MWQWIRNLFSPKASKRADGANSTTGINALWRPKLRKSEHENRENWQLTAARARNLARNSGYIARYLSLVPQMVCADGREPMPRITDAQGILQESLNDKLKAMFFRWAETCDAAGQQDIWQLQDIIMRTVPQDGEIFAHVYVDAGSKAEIPLKIALYEVDYLDTTYASKTPDKTTVYRGIEVDANGKPVMYHFKNPESGEEKHIDAANILHIYRKDRASQIHGETWLYPIVQLIRNLDEMALSELISARVQSTVAGVVKRQSPENAFESGIMGETESTTPTETTKHEYLPTGENSGQILYLNEGETLDMVQTSRPNSVFDQFIKLHLQQVAAGLGISYDLLTADYRSSYTGSRLAYFQDQAFFKQCFKLLESAFLVPLWKQFIKQCAIKGYISASQYNAEPWRYEAVQHSKPVFPYFKPLEDQKVQLELVKLGVLTLDELCASMGKDLKSTLKQRQKENELLAQLGLPLPGASETPESINAGMPKDEEGGSNNA